MKKLICIVFALVLMVCMATTAFAAVGVDLYNAAEVTEVTVPAGTFASVTITRGGYDLLITGEGAFTVKYNNKDYVAENGEVLVPDIQVASMFTPTNLRITNNSGIETTYSMIGQFPLGSQTNPDELEIGENAAQIEAGANNYYINWTAAASGVLTITLPTDMDWFFTYSNFGSDREDGMGDTYGKEFYSTDDSNVVELEVKSGDTLAFELNTYDPEDSYNNPAGTIAYEASFEIVHPEIIHFDAIEPGCHYNGNIEYWYCADCEGFWADEALTRVTNSKSVVLPATGGDVKHFEASEPACHRSGNIEYWFCEECEQYWQNEALTQLTNAKRVKLAGNVALEYHKKVDATCTENGMEEYWYCSECDCFYTDPDGIFNIASKRLTILATGHNLVDGECTVCGENPSTGDAGIVSVVAAMLVSAMGTVALVSKKKEF